MLCPLPMNKHQILLEAFIAPWENQKQHNCMLVGRIAEELMDYSPSTPSIGQVKVSLNHLNTKKPLGQMACCGTTTEMLAPAVDDINCASILQFKYPKDYKHALISSTPKVRNPVDVKNYFRQISVLPKIAKVLEKF